MIMSKIVKDQYYGKVQGRDKKTGRRVIEIPHNIREKYPVGNTLKVIIEST